MASQTPSTETITLEQLKKHNIQEDLWIAVHGKVYDLTPFAPDHPGGLDVLKECAGTDGTEPFDYVGHSADVIKTMDKYLVGRLAGSEAELLPIKSATAPVANPSPPQSAVPAGSSTLSSVAAVLSLAIIFLFILQHAPIPETGMDLGSTSAFLSGLLCASSVGSVGFWYMYSRFNKTLVHHKEVFAYPPLIPRRKKVDV